MDADHLAVTTAVLATAHAAAETAPELVNVSGQPPTALGLSAGETLVVALLSARVVAVLALPVGAGLAGYAAGHDLTDRYRPVIASLAGGGAVGGAVGATGVAVAAGAGLPLVAVTGVGGALQAAVGFAVVGFAGAAFAHVRTASEDGSPATAD